MRSPAVPDTLFGPWADALWTRLPQPPQPSYEVARWQATLDGTPCVVVAYGNEKNRNLRLAVQGVNVSDVPRLTKALYDLYFRDCSRAGTIRQRQTRPPGGGPPPRDTDRPAPRGSNVGRYREGGGRR